MRSIAYKLILGFMGIGLISITLIVLLARWNTRAEFIRFISDRDQADFVTPLADYFVINGTWDGVTEAVQLPLNAPPPGAEIGSPPPFTITDKDGRVIAAAGLYALGDQVPQPDLDRGIPIVVDGDTVGVLVMTRLSFEKPVPEERPLEAGFIQRTNLLLLYSALMASAVALILGVYLSRTLTRPIRELTRATHAVSEGDLSQQVRVRSRDELGELASAFNRMSAELARSVNARRQMTADIAHELRTPLSLILGHAEAVHDGVLPPTRENFEIIREEAGRLEHLVDDLRTLSLADAGELSLDLQPVAPQKLLQDVAGLYRYQVQKKNVTLDLGLESPLPDLKVDPGRMTQVLTNILENALRFTPDGKRISMSARRVEDEIEIAILDSGPGIAAGDLDRIFDRFYRIDPARHREAGGSGLGLAIARSIIQAQGGQIRAESRPGNGLKILILLPTVAGDDGG